MTESARPSSPLDIVTIADRFVHQGNITEIHPLGNGNINDTFLVRLDDRQQTCFVLQRINTQVFRYPQRVMQNMRIFTEHVHHRLQTTPLDRRWEVPRVILTQTQQDHWEENGDFWRSISFIEGSESFDTLQDPDHAREMGFALGMFHSLISDLPPQLLSDTLEGFHIAPRYLQQYEAVVAQAAIPTTPEVTYALKFVGDRSAWVPVLETAKDQGKLPLRLMHGDPKVNNVMFEQTTQKAVGMVDLDTVKPGLVHYDIGDCLRSGCNPLGEETRDWERVVFETDLCQSILQGYCGVAKSFFTENDYAYLYDAMRLIAFELGLRFFTDYLAGNVYFKVKDPEHNLRRALVQFKLTESIETQAPAIHAIVQDLQ